jgi:hypothetical protein
MQLIVLRKEKVKFSAKPLIAFFAVGLRGN